MQLVKLHLPQRFHGWYGTEQGETIKSDRETEEKWNACTQSCYIATFFKTQLHKTRTIKFRILRWNVSINRCCGKFRLRRGRLSGKRSLESMEKLMTLREILFKPIRNHNKKQFCVKKYQLKRILFLGRGIAYFSNWFCFRYPLRGTAPFFPVDVSCLGTLYIRTKSFHFRQKIQKYGELCTMGRAYDSIFILYTLLSLP